MQFETKGDKDGNAEEYKYEISVSINSNLVLLAKTSKKSMANGTMD